MFWQGSDSLCLWKTHQERLPCGCSLYSLCQQVHSASNMLKSRENRRERLCQRSGLSLQHSRSWEEADVLRQGANSEFVRIRIVFLGLAGLPVMQLCPAEQSPSLMSPGSPIWRTAGLLSPWNCLVFLLLPSSTPRFSLFFCLNGEMFLPSLHKEFLL